MAIFVTSDAKGVGRAGQLSLARERVRVVVTDVPQLAREETACRGQVPSVCCDLCHAAEVEASVSQSTPLTQSRGSRRGGDAAVRLCSDMPSLAPGRVTLVDCQVMAAQRSPDR